MRLPLRFSRISKVQIYTDGAIRTDQHISGLGAIVKDTNGSILHWWAKRAGPMTNNEAEYAAVIFALEQLQRLNPTEVAVFSDSRIVVDPMRGLATLKAPGLKKAFVQVRALVMKYKRVTFHHIPRKRNRLADALANDAADGFL